MHFAVPARYAADEAAETSTIDTVDTKGTSWVATGEGKYGISTGFKRIHQGSNQWWFIANADEPSDYRLTTPKFTINGQSFGLRFRHRWAFESDAQRQKDFDGGVVEISTDGGASWRDISELGQIDYNVTLDDDPRGSNPLKGRKAYGKRSAGYPDKWVTTEVRVNLPAPPESVQIRFRAGSDDNTTDVGWEIDDIELLDVTSKPFWSFIPHRDQCDPLGPKVEAGPGQTVHAKDPVTLQGSGAHPKNAPLTFFWTQTAGPTVQMRGENTATLAFDAPDTKDPVKLTFALRAHDGSLLSAASYVDVTVTNGDVTNNPGGGGGEGSSGCGCTATGSASSNLGAIALAGIAATFVRRRRRS